MTDLEIFSFQEKPVRMVLIDGVPYFVGTDVATTLGYKNPHKAVRDHTKGGTICSVIDNRGINQDSIVIPEGDIFRLIIRSKLPSAVAFENWVVNEVLPSIRKNGTYSLDKTPQVEAPKTYLEALKAAVRIQEDLENQGKELIAAKKTINTLTHTKQTYTTSQIAKELGMKSAQELNALLLQRGMHYKQNGSWMLVSWLSGKGYTSMKNFTPKGTELVMYNTQWTQAGRLFLLEKFAPPIEEQKLLPEHTQAGE